MYCSFSRAVLPLSPADLARTDDDVRFPCELLTLPQNSRNLSYGGRCLWGCLRHYSLEPFSASVTRWSPVSSLFPFSFLLLFLFFSVLGFSDYPTTFQAPSHHPLPCMNKVHLRLTKTSLIIITFQNFPTYVFAYYFRALAVCNFVRAIFFATFSFNHPRGAPSSPSAAPVVRKTLTCRRQSRPRCARGGRGQTPSPRPRAYRRPPPPRARPMTPSRW